MTNIGVTDPNDQALPEGVVTWSVIVNGKDLDYGQIHEMIHRDIATGNDYRKERIKLLTTLATGVFALTVTFHKDLFGATLTRTGLWLLLAGWGALLLSLLAGIFHFRKWEDFYLEHRSLGLALWNFHAASDDDDKRKASIAYNRSKRKINQLQDAYKNWNFLQTGGLIAGLTCMAIYVAITGFAVTSAKTSPPAAAGKLVPEQKK
jgi:hypothetical protein